ncbi:CBS domain-containing protein [Moritella sp. F3]|uniref:CBS domain-containing protein n=1 Tax=Moritella sp. F3 TaxID=2718882 RepID=UPI0018E1C574|nr:CBS domain-containing protein [Moritella sp. F3]GIC79521.1 CBS domain-containing protein [Moritella sp. F1]GIC80055.1 CBS domain-containing protein [Moritella sp. F3]
MSKVVIKANAVMTQNYICMDGMQTVREAITAMKEHDTKVIIVNKRDQHDAYGILVLSDIAKQVLAKDRSPDRVNIYEIMAKPIVSVPPEMDIRYCARLFERFSFSHTPVIENEEILGLVGYKELILHEL